MKNKRYHCPFCPGMGLQNDDLALSVNWGKGVYVCFRCGTSGRVSSLPKNMSKPSFLVAEDRPRDEEPDLTGMISLRDSKRGQEYIRSRNLNPKPLLDYVFVAHRKRIVFPIYHKGRIVYYISRKMWGSGRRYDNMRSEISHIFRPYEAPFGPQEELVVTEGIFDCLSVWQWLGIPCIALLGKNPNTFKFSQIVNHSKRDANIIILLDAEEDVTARFYYQELKPLRPNVKICHLPWGDPNEVGERELWKRLMPLGLSGKKRTS